jgi:positive phototaxis protein PixI
MISDNVTVSTATHNAAAPQSFLQFYLTTNRLVLISVQQLMEILTFPTGQIVPMFQMPPWVMGVHNWRGEVLWMVDFNHLVGLTPWYQQSEYTAKHTVVVIRSPLNASWATEELMLGLVVNRVEDMVICAPDTICPPADPPPDMPGIKPFLRGYWQPSPDQQHCIVDGAAILKVLSTAEHSPLF